MSYICWQERRFSIRISRQQNKKKCYAMLRHEAWFVRLAAHDAFCLRAQGAPIEIETEPNRFRLYERLQNNHRQVKTIDVHLRRKTNKLAVRWRISETGCKWNPPKPRIRGGSMINNSETIKKHDVKPNTGLARDTVQQPMWNVYTARIRDD